MDDHCHSGAGRQPSGRIQQKYQIYSKYTLNVYYVEEGRGSMRMLVVSESYQNSHNGAVSYQLTYVKRRGGSLGGENESLNLLGNTVKRLFNIEYQTFCPLV